MPPRKVFQGWSVWGTTGRSAGVLHQQREARSKSAPLRCRMLADVRKLKEPAWGAAPGEWPAVVS